MTEDKFLNFSDFFEHDEPVVSIAAKFLAEVEAKYKAGEISADEFKELAADALEIQDMSGLADDLDRKVMISRALSTLKIIASFIPV